jgi:hypothetical protein
LGLKENVIIGKLIPAGTGMKRYRNIGIDYGVNSEYMESFSAYKYEDDEDDDMLAAEIMEVAGMTEVAESFSPDVGGAAEEIVELD